MTDIEKLKEIIDHKAFDAPDQLAWLKKQIFGRRTEQASVIMDAIRPFAVGRKNWMHSNTANGAKASAALYSIVATAQANGLNTEQYLTELFSHPAGTILLPFTI